MIERLRSENEQTRPGEIAQPSFIKSEQVNLLGVLIAEEPKLPGRFARSRGWLRGNFGTAAGGRTGRA